MHQSYPHAFIPVCVPHQSLVLHYHEQGLLHTYLDLHAHATKVSAALP